MTSTKAKYLKACLDGDMDTFMLMMTKEDKKFKNNKLMLKCLYNACLGGHYNIYTKILEYRDLLTMYGTSETYKCLNYTCQGGCTDILDELFDINMSKPDMSLKQTWINCLYGVTLGGRLELYKMFITQLHSDFGEQHMNGNDDEPVFVAAFMHNVCESGNTEMVEYILQQNNTKSIDWLWDYALERACVSGSLAMVKLIIDYGGDYGVDDWDNGLYNLCFYCCGKADKVERTDIMKLMIEKGATNIEKCLYTACVSNCVESVRILISKCSTDIEVRDIEQCMLAAYSVDNDEIIQILTNKWGTNLKLKLLGACFAGNIEVFKHVIKKYKEYRGHNDSDINYNECLTYIHLGIQQRYNNGYSGYESSEKHIEIIKFIVAQGVCIISANNWLVDACFFGDLELIKILIDQQVVLFDRGLIKACLGGHANVVKMMLNCGAKSTTLNEALINNQHYDTDITNILLQKGADIRESPYFMHANDYKLYCLFCKKTGRVPDTNRLEHLFREYPPCVLFVGSRCTTCSKNCPVKKLPSELFQMLGQY